MELQFENASILNHSSLHSSTLARKNLEPTSGNTKSVAISRSMLLAYSEMLDKAGNPCKAQTLQLTLQFRQWQRKSFF